MDGQVINLAKTSAQRILDEADTLRVHLVLRRSVDLPPVMDKFLSKEITCWRNNGSGPDHLFLQMMPRVGGFPAPLARYFIAAYSSPGDLICDPYCGKGTVLFEATKMGRNAIGGDIAPDAVVSTSAKCSQVSFSEVATYIESLNFDRYKTVRNISPQIRLFYHPETLKQILSVRTQILADMSTGRGQRRRSATFVCGLLLGLLHGHSRLSLSIPCNQCFAMSPGYVRRYVREHGLMRPRRDVRQCLIERAMKLFPRPHSVGVARVYRASAEEFPKYIGKSKGEVGLVITSPPYLNRQTYSKDAWLRLWFLGYDYHQIARESLETGSIRLFVEAMTVSLEGIIESIRPGGKLVLIGGQARATVAGVERHVRINDLCLYALARIDARKRRLAVEAAIDDSKIMSRGSYFAVHGGKHKTENGEKVPRYGKEDILIVRKLP